TLENNKKEFINDNDNENKNKTKNKTNENDENNELYFLSELD
ncbi:2552_t:CDS:1, partial [Cetraspora pellucida]